MPVITIFSPKYCSENTVAENIAHQLGYKLLTKEVLEHASKRFKVPVEKLQRTLHGYVSIFNSFTREKEYNLVYLKAALAALLQDDDLVYLGLAAHLLPRSVSHELRVGLTASLDYRVKAAVNAGDFDSEKEALKAIKKEEHDLAQLTTDLLQKSPWDKSLYDIKIPMHTTSVEEAVNLVCENAAKDVVKTTEASRQAMKDVLLAAEVHVKLVNEGYFDIDVTCQNGEVTIMINKHVLRLENFANELKTAVGHVEGVASVEAKAGPGFHQADIYRRQSFERPQRVLLVDDETEYVQTLSERLQMRDFGTAVAYNGEEAISIVQSEDTDVMVLDLRMPGIDGIEVLRKLKREKPEVEVIILTGHGTEKDRELTMQLGAFAYLEKPVDIDKLSETMKAAYKKVQQRKEEA